MTHTKNAMLLATTAFALAAGAPAYATSFYFDSNQPYLSVADGPFASYATDVSASFWLEDFEDGLFNPTGATATYVGTLLTPGPSTDSVDGDDGLIDGMGTGGHSLFVHNGVRPSLVVDFDTGVLGQLPTFAGLVWTDGTYTDTVVFEAFDLDGHSLGTIETSNMGPDLSGETAFDRFFGVSSDGGIGSIAFYRTDGISGFEIDHLQYGYAAQVVPLPPALGLGLAGIGAVAIRRRRKKTA